MARLPRQLPCNDDGVCMVCKATPSEYEKLLCITCFTLWHASCLDTPKEILEKVVYWKCPNCITNTVGSLSDRSIEEISEIRAIAEYPNLLTTNQKAKRQQDFIAGESSDIKGKRKMEEDEVSDITPPLFDEHIQCSICLQLLAETPVMTPCAHNFCSNCFPKWMRQGKDVCPKCYAIVPSKAAIHEGAKVAKSRKPKTMKRLAEGPFVTKRAKKAGLANASSGPIFVTIPKGYFGPITAENDPERNRGVLVGDSWKSRIVARQWGVHLTHVSGISGQKNIGAQSVVLSGGYKDDLDQGEWFVYTGSGGRDLYGNKRTATRQSFDQEFVKGNEALRVSCEKGYPVRVLRSSNYKRSIYAPVNGYRYDGIYRIERCWRVIGEEGFLVCRYLFIRCDNQPAPWSSRRHGDLPRSQLPYIDGFHEGVDICERDWTESPAWDFDQVDCCWKWKKPPPTTKTRKRRRNNDLEKFNCVYCQQWFEQPAITTPCGHSFCKACLEEGFARQSSLRDRSGGHALLVQKNVFICPYPECLEDISLDFLQSQSQVNTELARLIKKLLYREERNCETSYVSDWEEDIDEGDADDGSDDDEMV